MAIERQEEDKELFLVPLQPKIVGYIKEHKRDLALVGIGAIIGILLSIFFIYVVIVVVSFISGFLIDRYFIKRNHKKHTEKAKDNSKI